MHHNNLLQRFVCGKWYYLFFNFRGKDIVPLIADAYQWYIQDRSLQREKSVVITNSYNGFCMRRIAVYTTDASR